MKKILFPPSLKKGAKIAVISPAGAVTPEQLEEGLAMISDRGFQPVLGKYLYTAFSHGYGYAGTEEERLQDLNWALNSDEIAAVWASRGGYGCQHLLRKVQLTDFRKNPKWYIGYSDNTVLQSYLMKHGFASVHGQTVKTSSFGITGESYDGIFEIFKGKLPEYSIPAHRLNKNGTAAGKLVGGNLALIYALLGTPYSFDFKGNILFFEDIGENFYALDRMLMSLDLAGVFRKVSGIIVGGMTNMGTAKDNTDYESSFDAFAYQIISERLKKYSIPMVFGFPNGHIKDNRPLIIGSYIEIAVSDRVHIISKRT